MSVINYQVQEEREKGKWGWFSDFRSWSEAKNMLDVYKRFYPQKKFRIVRTDAGVWNGQ